MGDDTRGKLILLEGARERREKKKVDNGWAIDLLRGAADRAAARPDELTVVGIIFGYADGSVGTVYAGPNILQLLAGLSVLEYRVHEESVD